MEQASPIESGFQPYALDSTLGAYLLGTYGSTALFGVTCLQAFIYYRTYISDRSWIKTVVTVLVVLETVHSALNIHGVYFFVVTNYFHPETLLKVSWSSTATILAAACTALVAHGFYAHRIFVVSGGLWWSSVIICVLALARAGCWFAVCVVTLRVQYLAKLSESLKYTTMAVAFSLATDIFIAACLTYHLHKGRTGRKRTDSLLTKLMIVTINNCLLTCFVDVLVLIFVIRNPHSLIYFGLFLLEGNLYTNSLLATLNARRSFKQELVSHQDQSLFHMPPRQFDGHTTPSAPTLSQGIYSSVLVFTPNINGVDGQKTQIESGGTDEVTVGGKAELAAQA